MTTTDTLKGATASQVANATGRDAQTIRRWVNRHELPDIGEHHVMRSTGHLGRKARWLAPESVAALLVLDALVADSETTEFTAGPEGAGLDPRHEIVVRWAKEAGAGSWGQFLMLTRGRWSMADRPQLSRTVTTVIDLESIALTLGELVRPTPEAGA